MFTSTRTPTLMQRSSTSKVEAQIEQRPSLAMSVRAEAGVRPRHLFQVPPERVPAPRLLRGTTDSAPRASLAARSITTVGSREFSTGGIPGSRTTPGRRCRRRHRRWPGSTAQAPRTTVLLRACGWCRGAPPSLGITLCALPPWTAPNTNRVSPDSSGEVRKPCWQLIDDPGRNPDQVNGAFRTAVAAGAGQDDLHGVRGGCNRTDSCAQLSDRVLGSQCSPKMASTPSSQPSLHHVDGTAGHRLLPVRRSIEPSSLQPTDLVECP